MGGGIEDVVRREYRASVVVITVGVALLGTLIYGIAHAETWVASKAQAATAPAIKDMESQHALTNITIADHTARIQRLEQVQYEQRDLLIEMRSDLKYLRQSVERRDPDRGNRP